MMHMRIRLWTRRIQCRRSHLASANRSTVGTPLTVPLDTDWVAINKTWQQTDQTEPTTWSSNGTTRENPCKPSPRLKLRLPQWLSLSMTTKVWDRGRPSCHNHLKSATNWPVPATTAVITTKTISYMCLLCSLKAKAANDTKKPVDKLKNALPVFLIIGAKINYASKN